MKKPTITKNPNITSSVSSSVYPHNPAIKVIRITNPTERYVRCIECGKPTRNITSCLCNEHKYQDEVVVY